MLVALARGPLEAKEAEPTMPVVGFFSLRPVCSVERAGHRCLTIPAPCNPHVYLIDLSPSICVCVPLGAVRPGLCRTSAPAARPRRMMLASRLLPFRARFAALIALPCTVERTATAQVQSRKLLHNTLLIQVQEEVSRWCRCAFPRHPGCRKRVALEARTRPRQA